MARHEILVRHLGPAIVQAIANAHCAFMICVPGRSRRAWSPTVRTAAAIVAASGLALPAAACGGSSGSHVVQLGTTTTRSGSSSNTSSAAVQQHGAVTFARCMRSHGLPNWPDPNSNGVFDKSKLQRLGYSVPQVRAVEDGPCNHLLVASSQGPTITPTDRADYLEAAACMRSHGFPDFPDPTFRNNNVQANIPSSIDQDSSRFRSAAAICTKLIPAGLPYSSSSAP